MLANLEMSLRSSMLMLSLCWVLSSAPALAIDDRFNPKSYEKGGFAPVSDATYTKECGGCHFAYLPGMLPARSWEKLFSGSDHFGEALALDPAVAADIRRYLVENAADRSSYRGSEAILYRLADGATPVRITQLPVMRQRHYVVENVVDITPKAPVKKLTNCNDCHERAAAGSFAYQEIVVPGVTKVVRPRASF